MHKNGGYPAYKKSGIEWLGEIPKHWNQIPLKRICDYISRGNTPDYVEESNLPVINQACIQWSGLNFNNVKYDSDKKSRTLKGLIQKGDILVNSTGTGTLGRVCYFDFSQRYLADGHVTIVRPAPDKILGKFLYYLFCTDFYQKIFYTTLVSGSTNQIELSVNDFKNTMILLAPLAEQQVIADYLDDRTARIDATVAACQRMIELLKERRVALINQVVTRGLNPDAPLKDSGIEWLGEIPEHWTTRKVKNGYYIRLGKMLQPIQNSSMDTLEPYLRAANVLWDKVDLDDLQYMWFSPDEKNKYLLGLGDLLICEGGDTGRAAIWDNSFTPCYIQNAVHRVRPKYGFDNRFLKYWLYSIKIAGYIDLICNKATIAHLTEIKLGNLLFLAPPLGEQQAIADYLDDQTARMDAAIEKMRLLVARLQEYRSALISAVVTGQVAPPEMQI